MGNNLFQRFSQIETFEAETSFLRKCGIGYRDTNVTLWKPEQVTRLRRIMAGDATRANPAQFGGAHVHEADNRSASYAIHEVRFDDVFDAFVDKHPAWAMDSDEDVALFFRTRQHIPNLKVIRRQMSGLCFMHAPVVLQHYLVALYQGVDYDLKMIDVASFIRNTWRGEALLQYLLYDNGGSSISFMREINRHVDLEVCNYVIPSPASSLFSAVCQEILERLRHRPALVSNFHIDQRFMRDGGVSFLEGRVDHSSLKGMHAMVLIGGRKNKEGEFVFLMQNWWNNRYFIEVSAAYFESARSTIAFIDSDISYIPDSFPVVFDLYAETSVDICERLNEI